MEDLLVKILAFPFIISNPKFWILIYRKLRKQIELRDQWFDYELSGSLINDRVIRVARKEIDEMKHRLES